LCLFFHSSSLPWAAKRRENLCGWRDQQNKKAQQTQRELLRGRNHEFFIRKTSFSRWPGKAATENCSAQSRSINVTYNLSPCEQQHHQLAVDVVVVAGWCRLLLALSWNHQKGKQENRQVNEFMTGSSDKIGSTWHQLDGHGNCFSFSLTHSLNVRVFVDDELAVVCGCQNI